ncbi:uncharacterized protein LOC144163112 [Haemaphysalis longicornis]
MPPHVKRPKSPGRRSPKVPPPAAPPPPGAFGSASPGLAAPLAPPPPPGDVLPPPPPPLEGAEKIEGQSPAQLGMFVAATPAEEPGAPPPLETPRDMVQANMVGEPPRNEGGGPKKEYVAAVKSYEQLVDGNVIRGKMYLECIPQNEAMGPPGGGLDRPPMGYYERPPPMEMDGRDRPYSPDRGRYPPDYDRRDRPRSRRDDDYYYDELPLQKESEGRAERIIQKIRQDIEAFEKENAVPDAKPSESLEARPRSGPLRGFRRATDDCEDDPDARRILRRRSSEDDSAYDSRRRSRARSKSRNDGDESPRRGRSRRSRDESSSSSSSEERRASRRRSGRRDSPRSSRRRRESDDQSERRSKRSRSRSKRRDDEERPASRDRNRRGNEVFIPRPAEDRSFMQAGMLFRYESNPSLVAREDVVVQKEAVAEDQGAPQQPPEGAAQEGRFVPPEKYQDFLLDVKAGRKPKGFPTNVTPSKLAAELGRYQDFLCSVLPEDTSPRAIAEQVGKYRKFIVGDDDKYTEFAMANNQGLARVSRPDAMGMGGYQPFAVQAKPLGNGEDDAENYGFAIAARPGEGVVPEDNQFAMQTRPQRIPSRAKGERYEHVQNTPELKTEWWSHVVPASKSKSVRGWRGGPGRPKSPHRRKAYDDEDAEAYEIADLQAGGPGEERLVQMSVRRKDASNVYSISRKVSPTATGYGVPPLRASPEAMAGGMPGMPMQGIPMGAMQRMQMPRMQMQAMPMQGMPMQAMPMQPMMMQPMRMQGMPIQYDPRYAQAPMRMDRRIQQMLMRQKNRSKFPVQPDTAMTVQAQPDRTGKRLFKYQVQNESRQQQADGGDEKAKENATVEASKKASVERVFSDQEVQVSEKRMSKATSARVKTRASEAGTHDAGSRKNVEAQAEIEEFPHVPFTRNPDFEGAPPGMPAMPLPGYPFPMPPYGLPHPVPSQQPVPQYGPPASSVMSQQVIQTSSATTVHTHQHHHHYHDGLKKFKVAYLAPNKGAKSVDRYEDQEPLGAAVGVQCMSLYERFMNWIYPDNKATEDVSVMTELGELAGDKLGKKDKSEESKKSEDKEKKGGSSGTDLKAKEPEKKKAPPGPPIPVNLPWQGHEYEYEEEIKPDGSRVGTYRYKGLGGAPKAPPGQGSMQQPDEVVTTTATQLEHDGQQFFERQVRTMPTRGVARPGGSNQSRAEESHAMYRRDQRDRSPGAVDNRAPQYTSKKSRVMTRVKGTEGDNFLPGVQIRMDFGDSSDSSTDAQNKSSDDWQPADMLVSYAHKNFVDKHMVLDDDDDDDMLPSGNVYGGHGSTKKLIRSRGRKRRGMPNKELLAYSMIVVVAVVGMALLIAMTGHKMHAGQGFGLNRHIVLNASKFRSARVHGGAGTGFYNAAPGACKDAHCLTKGAGAVRHLKKDYLKSACTDFYQFVCSHHDEAEPPQVVAQHALEDGLLAIIKSNEMYPELQTARQLYKECLNKEAVSERGWDPLNELQETTDLAGWPFTDPMQQPLIWRAAARLLRRFNLPALLSVGVEKHPHSPDTNIISVGLPELLLPYNLGNRSLKWYYSAVMHAVSPFREGAVAPVLAVEVSSFESHLSNIVAPRPKFAIQKLAAAHPELAEFLRIVLENITRLTSNTEFLVKDPEYVTKLLSLAKETAPHIVLNYLGFRALVAASPFLPAKVQALSALGKSPALRKQICLGVVVESLPVMSLYAGFNAFKPGIQNFKKANVTGATRAAVSSVMKGMSWMDDATKARVNKKILSSRLKAFLPAWISEQFKVFVQHEDVPMVIENEGLRSYAAIRRALFENSLKRETAHMEERWLGSILDRECSFDPRGGNIYAPITFWNVSFPTSDNFLMMHMPHTLPKMSHCLVTTLLREGDADQKGDVYSKPMWSVSTRKHFEGIRQCFVGQLADTASKDASRRDVISVIGDVAALSSSFKVYKSFVRSKHIDSNSFVKTFNMNVNQFFFVSYTASQCGNSPPTKSSYHSEMTSRDRVNTALKNSPEFQAAFRCPSNRAMNPANKCRLWRRSS